VAILYVLAALVLATAYFAAGTAIAYVMLDLLIELTKVGRVHVHAALPFGPEPEESLFAVVLGGLTASYAIDAVADHHSPRARNAVHVVFQLVSNALIGGVLVLEAEHGLLPLVLYAVAMLLHLVALEHHMQMTWQESVSPPWRFAVALAPALGAALWSLVLGEASLFIALALVAGMTLIQVVHDELPSPRATHVPAFVLGVAVFALLSFLRWEQ
jgi:hypothetical protein